VNASEASGSIDVGSEPSPLKLLGTFLREERERRGISTATLAAQLRMGEEQLQALEAGDAPRLPELVFVIAQARRVADALGVDVNPLVAPLKQQSQILKPAPTPLSSTPPAGRSQPRARLTAQNYTQGGARRASSGSSLRWIGSLALVAGVIAAGAWGWQRGPQLAKQLLPKPSAQPAPAAVKPPAANPTPAIPKTATVRELTVTASQTSWLTVRTSKGQQLYEGMFKGSRQFPLANGLQLRAGRPDLVKASLGKGPAKPLGPIDQIRWVNFNPPQR
jgi:cytoskeleton protein RodZ